MKSVPKIPAMIRISRHTIPAVSPVTQPAVSTALVVGTALSGGAIGVTESAFAAIGSAPGDNGRGA